MTHKILHTVILLLVLSISTAHASSWQEQWKAGTTVTEKQVADAGIDNCFTAQAIPDKVFSRMQGKSWKKDCSMKRSDLRYLQLLHRNAKGQPQLGEMICHRAIADKLVRIFRKLYLSNYRIERMLLIDEYDGDDERSMEANNTSCFNFRNVPGTKKLSKHSMGLAVDLNTRYNPYVTYPRGKQKVSPTNGASYANNRDKRSDIPYKIDHKDLAYQLFKAEGFRWGGDWKHSKDYQHFDYTIRR